MRSALTEIQSLGLGWEGREEMGTGVEILTRTRSSLPTFLRDQRAHTQFRSSARPMGSLWLG